MKKKDIILRVWGGVGNQLFIYAFAKVLSLITDCKVTLDIRTGFANDGYKRVYRLERLFNFIIASFTLLYIIILCTKEDALYKASF